jgi:hypothetical protein
MIVPGHLFSRELTTINVFLRTLENYIMSRCEDLALTLQLESAPPKSVHIVSESLN